MGIEDVNYVFQGIVKNLEVEKYKKVYIIAWFDLTGFRGIMTEVSNNREEIEKIYDEKYAPREHSWGPTEYSYKIIELDFNTIKVENDI